MTFWRDHTEPGTQELVSIQVLRGLAALVVVMAHIPVEIIYGLKWGDAVPMMLTAGAAADLFFVISGFVIVYASEPVFGHADAPRVFLLRRLARTVPLYWLTSGLVLAVILLTYPSLDAAVHSVGTVAGSFAMFPYLRPGGAPFPLNPPGWTMPYEMFFYVVFAVAILLSRARAVIAVAALFVALVIVGRLATLSQPLAGWCDPLILDFCFGMGIALAYRAGVRLPRGAAYALVGAAIAAYAASVAWGPFIAWRVVEWGIPGTFILAAVVLRPQPVPGRIIRALAFLGAASYSIFLTHYLVLPIPRRILSRFIEIPYAPWTLAFLLLVFAVVVGIVVHLLFERPLTRFLYRRIGEVREARVLRAAE